MDHHDSMVVVNQEVKYEMNSVKSMMQVEADGVLECKKWNKMMPTLPTILYLPVNTLKVIPIKAIIQGINRMEEDTNETVKIIKLNKLKSCKSKSL